MVRSPDKPKLTPRQHEIVLLVLRGLQNRQIAERLDLAENTVKEHIAKAVETLGGNHGKGNNRYWVRKAFEYGYATGTGDGYKRGYAAGIAAARGVLMQQP